MAEEMTQHIPPPTSSARSILVVDDDESMLQLCRRHLELAGYRVLVATGSPDALKLCANLHERIDLLLTDLFLPAPGLQLAQYGGRFPRVHGHALVMEAAALRKDLRVILMSAYSPAELSAQGITQTDLPLLHKPFKKEALLMLVGQTLAAPPPGLATARPSAAGGGKVQWID